MMASWKSGRSVQRSWLAFRSTVWPTVELLFVVGPIALVRAKKAHLPRAHGLLHTPVPVEEPESHPAGVGQLRESLVYGRRQRADGAVHLGRLILDPVGCRAKAT
jgi:hypothetical protein